MKKIEKTYYQATETEYRNLINLIDAYRDPCLAINCDDTNCEDCPLHDATLIWEDYTKAIQKIIDSVEISK